MYKIVGHRPIFYYLFLIIIHTINALLLHCLAERFAISPFFALVGSLIFTVMATHQDAIGWISSVSVLFVSLFSLLTLHTTLDYVQANSSNSKTRFLIFFIIPLLLLSREESLTIFPALFLLLFLQRQHLSTRTLLTLALFFTFFALSYLFFITTRSTWGQLSTVEGISLHTVFSLKQLKEFLTGIFAAYSLTQPDQLAPYFFVIFLILLLMGSYFIFWDIRGPSLPLLISVIWATSILVLLYVFVWSEQQFANRYLYLPSLPFSLFIMVALDKAVRPTSIFQSRYLWGIAFLLIPFLFFQMRFARLYQHKWQKDVNITKSIQYQLQQQLPSPSPNTHFFAYTLPPEPDIFKQWLRCGTIPPLLGPVDFGRGCSPWDRPIITTMCGIFKMATSITSCRNYSKTPKPLSFGVKPLSHNSFPIQVPLDPLS